VPIGGREDGLTASKTPKKALTAARAPHDLTSPEPMVRSPKQMPRVDSQIRGPNFFKRMFEGSSNRIYPTKRIITEKEMF
jgi:hypothetical protein